ncbi:CAMK protein kinase, variant 1 [Aphanomyces astaci]|uniref:CAMK protein kinase, variant 1 n=1 Tax=Aphanomyces astaci TaxID=112090 RepID=W4G7D4_APHAT|nr:CAMK protein kinase, variant 1 [Aphanomyces astaci]ETV74873.1 CAMK protein kinase, variant 1 [Aphanomyces astaci]|eukprot:XP_009835960.1 CAMK protein kinase, variant 1 [Aphanomyces astaci]
MGNFCGGLWCWSGDDDGSTNNLKHSFKGPSSGSLLRTVQNPDVSSLIEIEHEAKRNFHDTFILGRKLGSGSFAMVYECGEIATKKTYACKVYDRRKLDAGALECALMEPFLLRRMYHPGILRCQGFYKEDDMYIMVMEELRGGDVFDKLQEIKGDIHERDVCRLVKMFLEALAYIHARNIVHRDLKLENLMLDSTSPTTSTLKIVDFGFAIQLPTKDATLTEVLGTPGYMAPEVIQGGPYGKPADIWSAGVVVYTLLCGYPPFHHDRIKNIQTLLRSICCGYYFFDSVYWNDISLEAKRHGGRVARAQVVYPATSSASTVAAWRHGEYTQGDWTPPVV